MSEVLVPFSPYITSSGRSEDSSSASGAVGTIGSVTGGGTAGIGGNTGIAAFGVDFIGGIPYAGVIVGNASSARAEFTASIDAAQEIAAALGCSDGFPNTCSDAISGAAAASGSAGATSGIADAASGKTIDSTLGAVGAGVGSAGLSGTPGCSSMCTPGGVGLDSSDRPFDRMSGKRSFDTSRASRNGTGDDSAKSS